MSLLTVVYRKMTDQIIIGENQSLKSGKFIVYLFSSMARFVKIFMVSVLVASEFVKKIEGNN
jgi:hypothetical protein